MKSFLSSREIRPDNRIGLTNETISCVRVDATRVTTLHRRGVQEVSSDEIHQEEVSEEADGQECNQRVGPRSHFTEAEGVSTQPK